MANIFVLSAFSKNPKQIDKVENFVKENLNCIGEIDKLSSEQSFESGITCCIECEKDFIKNEVVNFTSKIGKQKDNLFIHIESDCLNMSFNNYKWNF